MDELVARVVIVGAIVGLAVAIGWFQRSGRAVIRRRRRFEGLPAGRYFFSSATCSTCDGLRQLIESERIGVEELSYESDPAGFAANRVDRVPAVAEVGADGTGWIAFGRPSRVQIRRWMAGP